MALNSIASVQPRTASSLSASLARLSDGLQIRRGSDSPAGLVVSEQQRATVAALGKSIATVQAGTSGALTGSAAFDAGTELLQDARDLALATANGTGVAAAYAEF